MDRECCQAERYAFALYNRFKVPKLYRYAVSGDWDLIPQRCQTHPKEAQFVHAYAPSDTALHKILQTPTMTPEMDATTQQRVAQVKREAVAALLSAHRTAVGDSFGRTPLHIACMDVVNSGGEAVASLIVDSSSNSCLMQDVEGRTPLHYLVGRNDVIPLPLLAKLISVFPKALKIQDTAMETPLEIVLQRQNEIEHVEAVIKLLKEGEQKRCSSLRGSANLRGSSHSSATKSEGTSSMHEEGLPAETLQGASVRSQTV